MVIPFRHPQGQALQAIILPAEKEFRKDVLQIGVCNAFFFAKLKGMLPLPPKTVIV